MSERVLAAHAERLWGTPGAAISEEAPRLRERLPRRLPRRFGGRSTRLRPSPAASTFGPCTVVVVNHPRHGAMMLHEFLLKYTAMPVDLIAERLATLAIPPSHNAGVDGICPFH